MTARSPPSKKRRFHRQTPKPPHLNSPRENTASGTLRGRCFRSSRTRRQPMDLFSPSKNPLTEAGAATPPGSQRTPSPPEPRMEAVRVSSSTSATGIAPAPVSGSVFSKPDGCGSRPVSMARSMPAKAPTFRPVFWRSTSSPMTAPAAPIRMRFARRERSMTFSKRSPRCPHVQAPLGPHRVASTASRQMRSRFQWRRPSFAAFPVRAKRSTTRSSTPPRPSRLKPTPRASRKPTALRGFASPVQRATRRR